jgi:hypothetical protein
MGAAIDGVADAANNGVADAANNGVANAANNGVANAANYDTVLGCASGGGAVATRMAVGKCVQKTGHEDVREVVYWSSA